MELREYQKTAIDEINKAWEQVKNVLLVLPTGAGKTVTFSEILRANNAPSCVIAHRSEILNQISLALAVFKVPHRIIGPLSAIRLAVETHIEHTGASYYDSTAEVAVAGVDTIVRRGTELKRWADSVTLWVLDEAHHLLKTNKWGTAVRLFKNARGLGVTATPIRADKKGLGACSPTGFFDTLVSGPSMRDLICAGFLSEYRVFCPPSDIDMTSVKTSAATGDFSQPTLRTAVRESCLVGDVVSHYQRIAPGKQGVTFATDVETSEKIASQFNDAGVPAASICAKTPYTVRAAKIDAFRKGALKQLVNVDLFGEGFDLPAVEVVSLARPTKSYGLFSQQFGRALRIKSGKVCATIIDHAGNVVRHGLPDGDRRWTIGKSGKNNPLVDAPSGLRVCIACTAPYKRTRTECPFCGHEPEPDRRDSPKYVDGDLTELTTDALRELRKNVALVDRDAEEYRQELIHKHAPLVGQLTGVKRHKERQDAQKTLRDTIGGWVRGRRAENFSDRENYKEFFMKFGVDVMTAQTLSRDDALRLSQRVTDSLAC